MVRSGRNGDPTGGIVAAIQAHGNKQKKMALVEQIRMWGPPAADQLSHLVEMLVTESGLSDALAS